MLESENKKGDYRVRIKIFWLAIKIHGLMDFYFIAFFLNCWCSSRDPTTPPGSNSSQNNVNHLTSAINALVLESPSRPTLPAALSTSNSLNNNVSSSSGVTNSPASNNNVSISSPPAAVATSPINNNSGAPPPHEPETPTQGRPADPQRARRSMRSVDDSARRRSARGSRNIMTQIPGRANGVSGRPAVDLPPGYGEFFF